MHIKIRNRTQTKTPFTMKQIVCMAIGLGLVMMVVQLFYVQPVDALQRNQNNIPANYHDYDPPASSCGSGPGGVPYKHAPSPHGRINGPLLNRAGTPPTTLTQKFA